MRPGGERLVLRREKIDKGKVLGREVSVMEVYLDGPFEPWFR